MINKFASRKFFYDLFILDRESPGWGAEAEGDIVLSRLPEEGRAPLGARSQDPEINT